MIPKNELDTEVRHGIRQFGSKIIDSLDLDPIYVAFRLLRESAPEWMVRRSVLAYWMFYDLGEAVRLGSYGGKDFWPHVIDHDVNGGRRGRERRHYRGNASEKSIRWLWNRFPRAEDAVGFFVDIRKGSTWDFPVFVTEAKRWVGFGDWIAFKMADMVERIWDIDVDFPVRNVMMYKQPREAAILALERGEFGTWTPDALDDRASRRLGQDLVVEHLIEFFSDRQAPPRYDRPVGLQEVETVLCKWKSHLGAHYPVGVDTVEMFESIERARERTNRTAALAAFDVMSRGYPIDADTFRERIY